MKKSLELLAPAQNYDLGRASIDAGADAVYIGGPSFGARVNAGNPISDIEKLVQYAHRFHAKVYVTLNTILYDEELSEAEQLIHDLYDIEVDAIIIQDMGILEMNVPPIPFFASTQTHNITPEKVQFLESVGFQRVILARELRLDQIKSIQNQTKVELEFFVQGALCVSYSGQCYMSQMLCGRSANRGSCAQPCRRKFDLMDREENIIRRDQHLLSLKDLNVSDNIPELIYAGIMSFKIEGRLKDMAYVRNNTAYYRQKLDDFITQNPDYARPSLGTTDYEFQPDPEKTFNRRCTTYFLQGRQKQIFSPFTEKSLGKLLGKVERVGRDYFILDNAMQLYNGDGICFFTKNQELTGTNINEIDGRKIFPRSLENISPGLEIYRNFDKNFTDALHRETIRKIAIQLFFEEREDGFLVRGKHQNIAFEKSFSLEKVPAQNLESAEKNVRKQLSKSGDSVFSVEAVAIKWSAPFFFPVKILNQIRREFLEALTEYIISLHQIPEVQMMPNETPYPEKTVDYHGNVSNRLAQQFYQRHGVEITEPAFELQENYSGKKVMTTKHCLKNELGFCPKKNEKCLEFKEPFFLVNQGQKFELRFDCAHCQMEVWTEE